MSMYDDIIKKKSKEWNAEHLMDGARMSSGDKLPFSSPLMNWSTYGGIPRNKISEFFGAPGAGKSTSAVDICKNAYPIFVQEHEERKMELRKIAATGNKGAKAELEELEENGPKKILYVDLEHSFDSAWAKTIGIKPEEIDIMQPPDVYAEQLLQTVQELIATGQVGLIVLDSIPSLVTQAELDKKFGERTVASLAGLLTIFFRKVVPLLTRYQCTLIYINQIRENMDNPYVVKTPGGQAPIFYSSLRILFQIGKPVDFAGNELLMSAENPAGYLVNAKIVKQKSAPNDRRNASYYLMCQSGIREDMDFAQLAIKKYGIINKAGGWFTMTDPYTGEVYEEDGKIVKVCGMPKVFEYLQTNRAYYDKIKKFILDDINGTEADQNGSISREEVEEL